MKQAFLYPAPELPDDTPLEHVRFSTRIRNALQFGGLKTVGDVRAASDAVLFSFRDLGHGSVQHLRETLGLWAEDEMTDAKVRRLVAIGEEMNKQKRSAEQQVADEADRRALHPLATRQTIADSQAAPAFQENHKRLKAERIAREAVLKAKEK
jgi:hypothetical protein